MVGGAIILLAVLIAIIYREEVTPLCSGGWRWVVTIPLINGVDLAFQEIRNNSTPPDWAGVERFQNVTHLMFSGRANSVSLYGKRPPSRTIERIADAYLYEFEDDGTAHNPFEKDSRVTDLHVRRSDLRRWIKDYVNQ